MGGSGYNSTNYNNAVRNLNTNGQTFARSTVAASTGNYSGNIADHLNPRKLKNGIRECCFAPGFNDALPIVVSIDATGSMEQIPLDIQRDLPNLITLLTEQGVSDHPNVLFMVHDDERAIPPDACFQISQFEAGDKELLWALNEVVLPGNGGGNRGEAYHLSLYAASRHLRCEAFERDGSKGFFFLIGDEEPYYHNGDPTKNGTNPAIANEVFGDTLEQTVTMLDSLKKLAESFHVFVIRPHHTMNGRNNEITNEWRKLFLAAGLNPECVIEVAQSEAIIPTMAITIGSFLGADRDDIVQVLKTKKARGVDAAANATALVAAHASTNAIQIGTADAAIVTAGTSGRVRS